MSHGCVRQGVGRKAANALRMFGCTVITLSPDNFNELLVGYRGRNYLLITQHQGERLDAAWRGQCVAIRDADEAVRIVYALDEAARTGLPPESFQTIVDP